LVSGIIMLIFACFYYKKVIKGPPELPKVNDASGPRRYGLFECCSRENRDTCLYAAFCLPVLSGKNYYAADICGFWPGCLLTFIGTYSPFYCLTVCIRTLLANKIEEKLGRKPDCLMNLVYTAFCFPCDVGRESLEIDSEIGATITCCCNVTLTPRVIAEVTQAFEKVEENIERSCDKYRLCSGDGH